MHQTQEEKFKKKKDDACEDKKKNKKGILLSQWILLWFVIYDMFNNRESQMT